MSRSVLIGVEGTVSAATTLQRIPVPRAMVNVPDTTMSTLLRMNIPPLLVNSTQSPESDLSPRELITPKLRARLVGTQQGARASPRNVRRCPAMSRPTADQPARLRDDIWVSTSCFRNNTRPLGVR